MILKIKVTNTLRLYTTPTYDEVRLAGKKLNNIYEQEHLGKYRVVARSWSLTDVNASWPSACRSLKWSKIG